MKKSTRNWLIIGGLGAAAVAIWWIMRPKPAADQTATDGTQFPGDTGYSGAYGTTPSLYGYTDPSTGAFITGVGAGSGGYVTQPTTNASWAQEVEAYLQNLGYDPMAVATAIGKYLTGQTLTSDQQGIVAAAQGFFGPPPQYVPPVSTTPPPGNGSGGGGGHGFRGNRFLDSHGHPRPWVVKALHKFHVSPHANLLGSRFFDKTGHPYHWIWDLLGIHRGVR